MRRYSATRIQLLQGVRRVEGRCAERSGSLLRTIGTASTSSLKMGAIQAALDKVASSLLGDGRERRAGRCAQQEGHRLAPR